MKDNEEKTFWSIVGTMTEFEKKDGSGVSRVIEIPTISLKANIFEQTERDAPKKAQPKVAEEDMAAEDDGATSDSEINIQDIPF